MNNSRRSQLVFIAGCCIALSLVFTPPQGSVRAESTGKTFTGVRFAYHSFTSTQMKDCYEYVPCFITDILHVRGRHGLSLEIGYLYREGEPTLLPTEWNVVATALSMWAVPFTVNYLHYIRGYRKPRTFSPYIGLGLGTYVGGEKIGALATTLLKQWDGWAWGFRGSMIGNVFIGAHITPWRDFDAVVEVRWIQSGRGGNVDLVDDEDAPKFDAYLYPLVQRSSYDFTGWSISMGIRW